MEINTVLTITQEDLEKFKRLDQFLSHYLPKLSRTLIKKLVQKNEIYLETNEKLNLSKMPEVGTKIIINQSEPEEMALEPENIPLDILYEDEHIIVINKAPTMVVHPAPGNYTGTLVHALLYHCKDLAGIGTTKRPGIVHRLDKGTSGAMIVAKTNEAHQKLIETFQAHDITRKYHALICYQNNLPQEKTFESLIGRHPKNRLKMSTKVKNGKTAKTDFKLIKDFDGLALVELTLHTGRTHQIRVHLTELLNAPIIGDPMYGSLHMKDNGIKKADFNPELYQQIKQEGSPLLHAKILGLKHPITGKELFFDAPYSPHFKEALKELA